MRPGSISAIIPTFNRRALLAECIESVLQVGERVGEVIVVNDGSTDDTSRFMTSLGAPVTLIDKPNGGKSSALNLGLARCRGDYVWICDDDDIAAADGVQHLAAALDADPEAGFAFGDYTIFSDTPAGRKEWPSPRLMREGEPSVHLQFLEGMFTFQYAVLVRRGVYRAVGPFDEALIRSQDFDMMIRIARAAKGVFVPKVIFAQRAHAGHRGSATHSFSAEEKAGKWFEFDKRIFARIRTDYALEEFTPTFAKGWPPVLARRAALIERACVFAERAMWEEAIADFGEAAEVGPDPVTPDELQLAGAVVGNALAWAALGRNGRWKRDLRRVRRANDSGARIVEACFRPLLWNARLLFQTGAPRAGSDLLKTMVDVLGPSGSVRRVSASMLS